MRILFFSLLLFFGVVFHSFSQGTISGLVFQDINKNGINDSEPPYNGIQIQLYNSNNILINSTTSESSMMLGSNFTFTGLPYGPYTIKFIAPSNYRFSSAPGLIVNDNANPATATTSQLFVSPTTTIQNAGLYYYTPPTFAPTIQATNLTVTTIFAKSVGLSWTRGNGNNVLIIGRQGAPVSVTPTDDHFYQAFYGFGSGEDLGNGNYVLYKGPANSIGIMDLKQLTKYYFAAFEYNLGSTLEARHLTTNPATVSVTTTEFSSGKTGNALSFNGTKNCLNGMGGSNCLGNTPSSTDPHYINNTGVFSIEMWLKLNNHNANSCQAIYTNGESANYKGVFFAYDNRSALNRSKQLVCELYNGSGTKIISSLSPENIITDNEWHHVAVTGDGTNIKFYVDGNQYSGSGTMGTKSTGYWTHNEGYFGACPITACAGGDISYQYWLNGVVDELKFWKITRTAQEIKYNMNLILTGDEEGLLSYFQFNEIQPNQQSYFVFDLLQRLTSAAQGGYAPAVVKSEAPVAKGTYAALNVSSSGTYDFVGTGVKMTFPVNGNYPNGELVVTRLKETAANLPSSSNSFPSDYWVIRNYGANQTFSPLQSITFDNLGVIPDYSISDPANGTTLYKRPSNASASSWNNFGSASNVNGNAQIIGFNSSNNITSFSQILIGYNVAPIDLKITSPTAITTAKQGENISLSCTIENTGTLSATSSNVGYYLSKDNILDGSDLLLGSSSGSSLSGPGTSLKSQNVIIPASTTTGNYYLIFVADYTQLVNESNETNNTAATPVTIIDGADLVISSLTIPLSAEIGQTIALEYTIKNEGTSSSATSNVAYYLSFNNVYDVNDLLLGSVDEGMLADQGYETRKTSTVIPASTPPGKYYIIAIADYDNNVSEFDETNNSLTVEISIEKTKAIDYIVTLLPTPILAQNGESITINFKVLNKGTKSSTLSSNTKVFLSTDNFYSSNDVELASLTTEQINSGNSITYTDYSVSIPSNLIAGDYYLIVASDFNNEIAEEDETNNMNSIPLNISVITRLTGMENNLFKIYPNPSTTHFVVEPIDQYKGLEMKGTLINELGSTVMNKVFNSFNENIFTIENLPKGVYTLKLETETQVEIKKIIIQ